MHHFLNSILGAKISIQKFLKDFYGLICKSLTNTAKGTMDDALWVIFVFVHQFLRKW